MQSTSRLKVRTHIKGTRHTAMALLSYHRNKIQVNRISIKHISNLGPSKVVALMITSVSRVEATAVLVMAMKMSVATKENEVCMTE